MVEMLEQRYLNSLRGKDFDVEVKKHFFINYGLRHEDCVDYCLDFIDMFDEIWKQIDLEENPVFDLSISPKKEPFKGY